ncbi:MAG: winged helix-turn-helix domain-containing protein [Thaumarchaeota archaeon]|nr:winged helix-turn-helix domain-containing protein [Nitrososphaerota archaeon]
MHDDPELRRLLWFLLGGSRGGPSRARIIQLLRDKPRNQNQLATDLEMQYKGVQHHVRVLVKSGLIVGTGEKYGITYSLTLWLEAGLEVFDDICRKLAFGPPKAA